MKVKWVVKTISRWLHEMDVAEFMLVHVMLFALVLDWPGVFSLPWPALKVKPCCAKLYFTRINMHQICPCACFCKWVKIVGFYCLLEDKTSYASNGKLKTVISHLSWTLKKYLVWQFWLSISKVCRILKLYDEETTKLCCCLLQSSLQRTSDISTSLVPRLKLWLNHVGACVVLFKGEFP